LKTKLLELEVHRLMQSSEFDIEVIDQARALPNAEPDYPELKVFAYVGFGLSVLLAFGIPFVREYINDSFDMPRDVEKALALPVLGTIPVYSRRKGVAR
jgi:capsular polysaccharide biosynthesis protein